MTKFSTNRSVLGVSAVALALIECLSASQASAQMFREPFSFEGRNRASMAIYMDQRSNGSSGAAFAAGAGGGETLVCAGTGTTTATSAGNIMCVLAGEGANIVFQGEQDSDGNQTSDANTNQTAADEIGEVLNGDTNG